MAQFKPVSLCPEGAAEGSRGRSVFASPRKGFPDSQSPEGAKEFAPLCLSPHISFAPSGLDSLCQYPGVALEDSLHPRLP